MDNTNDSKIGSRPQSVQKCKYQFVLICMFVHKQNLLYTHIITNEDSREVTP